MKKQEINERIEAFLEDYNALLEWINDELEGMGIAPNKLITNISEVNMENLECDKYLYFEYLKIKK
jgi:hypothetical protein